MFETAYLLKITAVWLGQTLLKAALKYGLYKGKFKERAEMAPASAWSAMGTTNRQNSGINTMLGVSSGQ